MKFSLLVSSCDAYSDLWRPYFSLLRKNWPDCPVNIFLVTEELDANIPGVTSLRLGAGKDWSSLLLEAIDSITTPYVLLSLEDFFLRKKIDNDNLLFLMNEFDVHNLAMMRLIPRPCPGYKNLSNSKYGILTPMDRYRVSTQAAFWRTDVLKELIVPGESAWEFEINGSERSKNLDRFVGLWSSAFPYRHHCIERGKWFPWDYLVFVNMNIGVDKRARKIMGIYDVSKWMAKKVAWTIFERLNKLHALISQFLSK